MQIPDSTIVIREYQEHSGTINPEALIDYAHHAIEHSGNTIQYETRVDKVTLSGEEYRIDYTDTLAIGSFSFAEISAHRSHRSGK